MGDLLGEVAGEVGDGVTQELLTWALGIVKSRSFDATPETFVLSPLIDLINHAWEVKLCTLVTCTGQTAVIFLLTAYAPSLCAH
jgi:hypothetical protein